MIEEKTGYQSTGGVALAALIQRRPSEIVLR